ncbi:MAG: hypothetical protein AAGA68_02830 [Pseudomonadota bacterium]
MAQAKICRKRLAQAAAQHLVLTLAAAVTCVGSAIAQTSAGEAAAPCAGEEFRTFDFWLGDWQVRTADGKVAGANRITRREGGCVLLEQWIGASGSTGMSMNFYSPSSGRWNQVWHSASGALIDISGGWDGESMVLTGTIEYVATAAIQPFRGTWTPLDDGRVRQFFEQSDDGGDTWQPWFEGFYARRDASPEP